MASKLEVGGLTTSSDITIGSGGSTPDLIFAEGDSQITGPANANFLIKSRGNSAAEGLSLHGADGAGIEVNKAGQVGIGIAATSELTVGKTDAPQIDLVKNSTSDAIASIYAATDAGTGGKLIFKTKRNGDSALDRLTIDDDGTVKFGTSNDAGYIAGAVPNSFNSGYGQDNDTHATWINFYGYNGGDTKYRDLKIGNGRSTAAVVVQGSTGGIYEVGGVLKSNLLTNSGFDCWSNSTLEDATGTELVVNGTFASNITGWNQIAGTVTHDTGGDGGRIEVDATSSATARARPAVIITVEVGKLYKFSAGVTGATGYHFIHLGNSGGGATEYAANLSMNGASGTYTHVFEATSTSLYVELGASASSVQYYDDVSVKEVTPGCVAVNALAPDRWYKSATLDLTRISHNTTNVKGMYGCKMYTGGTGIEEIYQPAFPERGEQSWYNRFRGRKVTFGCWLYADSAASDGARAYVRDQDGYTYATKVAADTLTWVEVTRTVSSTAWTSTSQFLSVGVAYATGSAAKTCYVSEPIMVLGNAIGEGNYSRPSGEIVVCEGMVRIQNNVSPVAADDKILNLEAMSDGKIPKGCKAVNIAGQLENSAVTTYDGVLWQATSTGVYQVRAYPLVANFGETFNGLVTCDSNGDIYQLVTEPDATLSGLYQDVTAIHLR